MKTIKPGTLPQPKCYSGKCTNCGCKVECNEAEVLHAPPCSVPPVIMATKVLGLSVNCPTVGCEHGILLRESVPLWKKFTSFMKLS